MAAASLHVNAEQKGRSLRSVQMSFNQLGVAGAPKSFTEVRFASTHRYVDVQCTFGSAALSSAGRPDDFRYTPHAQP